MIHYTDLLNRIEQLEKRADGICINNRTCEGINLDNVRDLITEIYKLRARYM